MVSSITNAWGRFLFHSPLFSQRASPFRPFFHSHQSHNSRFYSTTKTFEVKEKTRTIPFLFFGATALIGIGLIAARSSEDNPAPVEPNHRGLTPLIDTFELALLSEDPPRNALLFFEQLADHPVQLKKVVSHLIEQEQHVDFLVNFMEDYPPLKTVIEDLFLEKKLSHKAEQRILFEGLFHLKSAQLTIQIWETRALSYLKWTAFTSQQKAILDLLEKNKLLPALFSDSFQHSPKLFDKLLSLLVKNGCETPLVSLTTRLLEQNPSSSTQLFASLYRIKHVQSTLFHHLLEQVVFNSNFRAFAKHQCDPYLPLLLTREGFLPPVFPSKTWQNTFLSLCKNRMASEQRLKEIGWALTTSIPLENHRLFLSSFTPSEWHSFFSSIRSVTECLDAFVMIQPLFSLENSSPEFLLKHLWSGIDEKLYPSFVEHLLERQIPLIHPDLFSRSFFAHLSHGYGTGLFQKRDEELLNALVKAVKEHPHSASELCLFYFSLLEKKGLSIELKRQTMRFAYDFYQKITPEQQRLVQEKIQNSSYLKIFESKKEHVPFLLCKEGGFDKACDFLFKL